MRQPVHAASLTGQSTAATRSSKIQIGAYTHKEPNVGIDHRTKNKSCANMTGSPTMSSLKLPTDGNMCRFIQCPGTTCPLLPSCHVFTFPRPAHRPHLPSMAHTALVEQSQPSAPVVSL